VREDYKKRLTGGRGAEKKNKASDWGLGGKMGRGGGDSGGRTEREGHGLM